MFSLSILKENFNVVEVACTGKCSLLIVNTDSPLSMSTFSSSTYFLGVLEPRSSHGKLLLWCFISEFLILCKACLQCCFWKSAPSSHTAQACNDGILPFPYTETPLMVFLLLGDTKRQEKGRKQKLSTQFEIAPLPTSLLWLWSIDFKALNVGSWNASFFHTIY